MGNTAGGTAMIKADKSELDMRLYKKRLSKVVRDAMESHASATGGRSSIRKLASFVGRPKCHSTLQKWHKGKFTGPIYDSSYELLAAIDADNRSQIELKAYLEDKPEEEVVSQFTVELLLSTTAENQDLKERLQKVAELVAA